MRHASGIAVLHGHGVADMFPSATTSGHSKLSDSRVNMVRFLSQTLRRCILSTTVHHNHSDVVSEMFVKPSGRNHKMKTGSGQWKSCDPVPAVSSAPDFCEPVWRPEKPRSKTSHHAGRLLSHPLLKAGGVDSS